MVNEPESEFTDEALLGDAPELSDADWDGMMTTTFSAPPGFADSLVDIFDPVDESGDPAADLTDVDPGSELLEDGIDLDAIDDVHDGDAAESTDADDTEPGADANDADPSSAAGESDSAEFAGITDPFGVFQSISHSTDIDTPELDSAALDNADLDAADPDTSAALTDLFSSDSDELTAGDDAGLDAADDAANAGFDSDDSLAGLGDEAQVDDDFDDHNGINFGDF